MIYLLTKENLEETLKDVCSENPLDIKNTNDQLITIELKNPHDEINVSNKIPYSIKDVKEFKEECQQLLEKGIIRESKSPHSASAFYVENKNEIKRGKRRMVINYKKMNDATIGDSYKLPRKDYILEKIKGSTFFSTFDAKSGYWQLRLDESTKPLTVFSCPPQKHYEWNVLPFGLKQAPSIYQRFMDNSLQGLEDICLVYIDDIIVFTSENKQKKLSEKIKWDWTQSDTELVQKIKKSAQYLPALYNPETKDFLIIETDASNDTWAGCMKAIKNGKQLLGLHNDGNQVNPTHALAQSSIGQSSVFKIDKHEKKLCKYISGTFTSTEQRYITHEKETLACLNTLKKWKIDLLQTRFKLRTDSKYVTGFWRYKLQADLGRGRTLSPENGSHLRTCPSSDTAKTNKRGNIWAVHAESKNGFKFWANYGTQHKVGDPTPTPTGWISEDEQTANKLPTEWKDFANSERGIQISNILSFSAWEGCRL
ncbi:uncharacterized protein [Rutidosis leptorrhynchoides]|uniref:uncharacterized protein n=1 Tax=Rutidosis leptorrhynchoides TaxID=125765 RepID=UPI003A99862F